MIGYEPGWQLESGNNITDVKVGDVIEIQFGNKNVRARVTDVKETVKKDEAKDMFEYL